MRSALAERSFVFSASLAPARRACVAATQRPFVEHAISAFGWDRVVWGSDWPVCTLTADLGRWVAATHALLAGASESEKTKLLSANAERIYRL